MEQRDWSVPSHGNKFSQFEEETILINLADAFLGKVGSGAEDDRFIVDIGAGDGANLSNSKRFIDDYGWRAFRVDGAHGEPDVKAPLVKSWVTAGSIVRLLQEAEVPKDFDILSLDIDGIDLYVLRKLLVADYAPSIICFEFNGCRDPRSYHVVQYTDNFKMVGDYYGASWNAFRHVLGLHGYTLVHHSKDVNGYAVRNTLHPVACATMPSKNQYHPWNKDAVWHDAAYLFQPWGSSGNFPDRWDPMT